MVKMKLSGAVRVRWDTQVGGMSQVSAKFELVVAKNLRPVIRKLNALLFFNQRTVATTNIQAFAEAACTPALVARANRAIEEERRQPVGGRIALDVVGIGWQSHTATGCRCVALVELRGMWIVAEPSKPDIGHKRRSDRVIESSGQAVVVDGRTSS